MNNSLQGELILNNRNNKPMLSAGDLVTMLAAEKGISFQYMDKATAMDYLTNHNNYLRTASYRKNYDKHTTGINIGKYIHLDFAYLVEMSKLDMYLRGYLLQMCIDIEHALKVQLINDIEANADEDGYTIVDEFLNSKPGILSRIAGKSESVFTGDLIIKYFELYYVFEGSGRLETKVPSFDCPVWVLVEVLAFKDFVDFLIYYGNKYPERMSVDCKLLNTVRSLRNACAHNNCILFSLRPGSAKPTSYVSRYVSSIPSIGKEERKKKLSCRPLYEITCLLIIYNKVVAASLRCHRMKKLKEFVHGRLIRHQAFFADNQTISTAFSFLQKIVDSFT